MGFFDFLRGKKADADKSAGDVSPIITPVVLGGSEDENGADSGTPDSGGGFDAGSDASSGGDGGGGGGDGGGAI